MQTARTFLEQQNARAETSKGFAKMAALLRHRGFRAWLMDTERLRFDWATADLLAKLNKDLLAYASWELAHNKAPLVELLDSIAAQLDKAAKLAHEIDHPETPAPAARFIFSQGSNKTLLILEFARSVANLGCAGAIEDTSTFKDAGKIAHCLFRLATARRTLEQDTRHAGFEAVLASLTTEYMLEGAAMALLGNCAQDVQEGINGKAVTILIMRKGWCMPFWYTSHKKMEESFGEIDPCLAEVICFDSDPSSSAA